MMATTHALAGMCLGLALSPLAPSAGPILVLAGAVGGVLPDLDVARAHRRDLHFPVYGTVGGLGLLAVAVTLGQPWLLAAAVAVGAAALHAVSDAVGGGRALRPWRAPVERAVYCHAQGRWWQPRRWIGYDGSPGDLAVAAGLALPLLAVVEAPAIRWVVAGLLAVSIGYALVRRRVPDVVETLAERVPT